MLQRRLALAADRDDGRLFVGPRGDWVSTAILRDATNSDEVVASLGFDRLRRHDLRHTGLTWMADAGVPLNHLHKIAGHGSLTTTQRYLHPDQQAVTYAGHLVPPRCVVVEVRVNDSGLGLGWPSCHSVRPRHINVCVRNGSVLSRWPTARASSSEVRLSRSRSTSTSTTPR